MEGAIDGKKAVGSLVEQLELANQETLKILQNFKAIENSARSFKTPSQGNQIAQTGEAEYKRANEQLQIRLGLLRKIEKAEIQKQQALRSASKTLQQQRTDTRLLNKENRDNAVLTSKFATEYQKLSVRLIQARKVLKDLVLTQGQNAQATKRAAKEVQNLDKRLKTADAVAGQFQRNVGNYPKTMTSAIGAVRGLVGAFGIYSGLQVAKTIFEQVKAIDGLNKALLQVTGTQSAFNAAQAFLQAVSDEAGSDILDLTSAYTKFVASAKTTNLTGEETNNIFRQVAKASGVLGLSTDDANGAFRALEQILSKGKVQAEEIRGQLGERLPGAFQILAKSMGLTTAQLDKQLRDGKVLSDEVLPKFADELERTYSLDKVERVETLAAEQNRLGNAWTNFIQNVEDGDGTISRVMGGLLASITAVVDALAELSKSTNAINKDIKTDKAKQELEDLEFVAEQTGKTLKEVAANNFFDYTKSVERARAEVKRLKKEQEGIPSTINSGRGIIPNPEYEKQNELLDAANKALALREGRLDAVNEVLRENNEKEQKKSDVIAGTIKFYTDLINAEKKIQTEQAVTKDAFDRSQNAIDWYKEKIRELTGEFLKLEKIDVSGIELSTDNIDFTKFVKSIGEGFKKAGLQFDLEFAASAIDLPENDAYEKLAEQAEFAYKRAEVAAEASGKRQREILQQTLLGAQEIYNIDLQGFVDILDKKEANLEDYAESSRETLLSVNDAILSGTLSRLDRERDEARHTLELIRSDAEASEEKRQQAEAEYRRKDLEIRKKQFKAEQKAAIARTIINTAVAIIQAYAQLGPIGGTIAGVLISALGTVQLAQIKSQKPPEFFRGKKSTDSFEGIGSVNELPGQREIGIDESGNLSLFPAGKHYRKIKRRDIIIPSMPEFERQIKDPTSDTFKRVSKKYGKDAERRIQLFHVKPEPMDTKPMEKMMERVMMKYANRPVHSHVTIKSQTKGYRV